MTPCITCIMSILFAAPGCVFWHHPKPWYTFGSSGRPQCLPRRPKPALIGLSWDFPAFFFAN